MIFGILVSTAGRKSRKSAYIFPQVASFRTGSFLPSKNLSTC